MGMWTNVDVDPNTTCIDCGCAIPWSRGGGTCDDCGERAEQREREDRLRRARCSPDPAVRARAERSAATKGPASSGEGAVG